MSNLVYQSAIRFVGGPLHNQHLSVPWVRSIDCPVDSEFDDEGRLRVSVVVEYCLRKITDFRGTTFFEFHCEGVPHCSLIGAGGWFIQRERFYGEKIGRIGLLRGPEPQTLEGQDGRGAVRGGPESWAGQPRSPQGGAGCDSAEERIFNYACRCQTAGEEGGENPGGKPALEGGGWR